MTNALPPVFERWFASRGWQMHAHQREMLAAARAGQSALLTAPTGGGKTLAGFLPSLIELSEQPDFEGLQAVVVCREHKLYRLSLGFNRIPHEGRVAAEPWRSLIVGCDRPMHGEDSPWTLGCANRCP